MGGRDIDAALYLRTFNPDDLASVYELACSTLSERYDPNLFTSVSSAWPQGFLVVDGGGDIKAFLLGIMTTSVHARVLMLTVVPEMRRHGIGTMLMTKFLDEAKRKGAKVLTLEVRKGNIQALEFYSRFNFMLIGEIKGYYNDGEDALQLQLYV
ncbi:MAG: GNAT family N-acetyltransferase [Methanomassiliicoccus sp.]|nr:GNAT family N-acetyltransferase [Methanomassiliicoccus sp.]